MNFNFTHRPRRLRNNPILRSLISENSLSHSDFVLPVFVSEHASEPEPIPSMPEIFRWPIGFLVPQIKKWCDLGISSFAIFPQIDDSKKAEQVIKLIDFLEDDDDVKSVHSNFDISENVMAELG